MIMTRHGNRNDSLSWRLWTYTQWPIGSCLIFMIKVVPTSEQSKSDWLWGLFLKLQVGRSMSGTTECSELCNMIRAIKLTVIYPCSLKICFSFFGEHATVLIQSLHRSRITRGPKSTKSGEVTGHRSWRWNPQRGRENAKLCLQLNLMSIFLCLTSFITAFSS